MANSLELFRIAVKDELERRKWPASRLASAAGLYASQLSRYLSGEKEPSLPVMDRVADALGKSVADLVRPAEPETPTEPLHSPLRALLARLPNISDDHASRLLDILDRLERPDDIDELDERRFKEK